MAARRNSLSLGKFIIKKLIFSSLLLFALPAFANVQDNNRPCLKLGADEGVEEYHSIFAGIVELIYERIGHCAISISVAPKRAEMMMATGALDADWMRADGFKEKTGLDIIEVPVTLFELDIILLSKPNSSFNGQPEDMKGRTVGFPAGFNWIEDNLLKLGAIPNEVPTSVPVRELLMRGRFDVFAIDGVRAYEMLGPPESQKGIIRQTSWTKVPFFHLVHARHKDKVDALARETQKAINAGEFDPLFALPGLHRVETGSN